MRIMKINRPLPQAVLTVLRVLVTGGSGYLGTHVRRFFDAEDFSRRSHLDVLSSLDASRVAAYDVVIHLAAHLSKDPAEADLCFRTNVEATVNLLREMSPQSRRRGLMSRLRCGAMRRPRSPPTCTPNHRVEAFIVAWASHPSVCSRKGFN